MDFNRITFCRGETKGIRISLVDVEGLALDITGYTRARVGIATSSSTDDYIVKDTAVEGDLISVIENPASVDFSLTQIESLSLPARDLFVDVWILLSGKWIRASVPLILTVIEGIGTPEL